MKFSARAYSPKTRRIPTTRLVARVDRTGACRVAQGGVRLLKSRRAKRGMTRARTRGDAAQIVKKSAMPAFFDYDDDYDPILNRKMKCEDPDLGAPKDHRVNALD